MSLKAKLEAVIYAAEEPVTLAQLASLFAEDAFALRAEQVALEEKERRKVDLEPGRVHGFSDSAPELSDLLAVVQELDEYPAGEPTEISIAILEDARASGPLTDALETAESSEAPAVETATAEPVFDEALSTEAVPAQKEIDAEVEAKRLEQKRNREVREILREVLDELIADYASDSRGIEIREIAGGFRMSTKPEIHDAVRSFVKSLKPALKLSLPALETLAVIAYKQPVTAPEVGEIRGVDSAGVLGSLMSRKLITTAGRKQVIGRPMLYKTTKEFLLRFGLKDVNELPSMEEFEKIAALELSETEDADSAGESYAGAAVESGELFPENEISQEEDRTETRALESEERATNATSTPTAEPSEEAAAAPAPVERQDAEEVEAER